MINVKHTDYIRKRVLCVANYTLETKSDIRSTAKKFFVSKSTVHLDLSQRLKKINPLLYSKIHVILVENKYEGQLKGGESTKKRYRYYFQEQKKNSCQRVQM